MVWWPSETPSSPPSLSLTHTHAHTHTHTHTHTHRNHTYNITISLKKLSYPECPAVMALVAAHWQLLTTGPRPPVPGFWLSGNSGVEKPRQFCRKCVCVRQLGLGTWRARRGWGVSPNGRQCCGSGIWFQSLVAGGCPLAVVNFFINRTVMTKGNGSAKSKMVWNTWCHYEPCSTHESRFFIHFIMNVILKPALNVSYNTCNLVLGSKIPFKFVVSL